jgi:hypothetical protein
LLFLVFFPSSRLRCFKHVAGAFVLDPHCLSTHFGTLC